jgi:hypothetical protein
MLPIPQCLALAVVIATLVLDKMNTKDENPFKPHK